MAMTSSSGSSRPDRHTIRLWASNDSMRVYGVLAIVLLVGVAMRCWDLARAPQYFADEVFAAVSAHNLVLNGTDLTGSIAHPLSYISDVLNGSAVLATFGLASVTALRVLSVLFGTVVIFGIFLIGKELRSSVLGLSAAAAAATMPWAIYYSRIYFGAGEVLATSTMGLYCLLLNQG